MPSLCQITTFFHCVMSMYIFVFLTKTNKMIELADTLNVPRLYSTCLFLLSISLTDHLYEEAFARAVRRSAERCAIGYSLSVCVFFFFSHIHSRLSMRPSSVISRAFCDSIPLVDDLREALRRRGVDESSSLIHELASLLVSLGLRTARS